MSILANAYEAYESGFSLRADVRLGVLVALTLGVMFVGGPVGVAILAAALIYTAVDMFGRWDWAYDKLSNTPLISTEDGDWFT